MMRDLFGLRFGVAARKATVARRSRSTRLEVEACEPRRVLSAATLMTVTPAMTSDRDLIPADVWTLAEDDHGAEPHAGDVVGEVVDGRLVTDHRAYGYEFEPDTTFYDVGFDVAGLEEGAVLEMEVLQGVTFWNGRGTTPRFTPARRGVELNFNNAAENVRIGATRNVGQLLEIGVAEPVEGGTEVHDGAHFDVTVGSGGAGDAFSRSAPGGIYVIVGRLVGDGVDSSAPLAFVFNAGASEEAHEAAVALFEESPPVSVLEVTTPEAGLYKAGDPITITAEFSSPVVVRGTPRLPITVGGRPRFATFDRAASTGENVAFTYVLKRNDNGEVAANGQIQTRGRRNSIVGAAGGPVFTQAVIALAVGVVADTTPPRVVGVFERTGEGTYGAGAALDFVVRMSKPVVVDVSGGGPTVTLKAIRGAALGSAEYVELSAPDELLFRTTVSAGQQAPRGVLVSGIRVDGGLARLVPGIITDSAGNPASLKFRPQRFASLRIVTA